MELQKLLTFIDNEHERLVTHYNVKNDPKTKFTMLAKLMEETGELSEAILTVDALQRSKKLSKKADVEGEIADVVFCTLLLAKELNVDVHKALEKKMKKVQKRKY